MSTTDPKKKVERSRNLASGYTLSNVIKSEDAITHTIELLLDWMDKYAENQQPMELDKFFTFTAFDVVGEVVFSKQFGFLRSGTDIGDAISNSLALNAFAAIGGFLQPANLLVANPLVTRLQVMPMGHLFNTTLRAITSRQRNQDARFDIAAHWFRTHAAHPDRLSLRDIHAQATTNVGAGADTVSCALQSFVYHMIRHRDAWRRARAEIDSSVAHIDRVVSFEDAQSLPFLQACIREALRVFGPVPMGLPRVAPREGVTVGERTFPEGTVLSINPWSMHHSKEIWGDDAHEFNPDRWFDESVAAAEKYWMPVGGFRTVCLAGGFLFVPSLLLTMTNLVQFGMGYNSCPGQNVAKIELSKIAATIVRDYDIRQVDQDQEWKWKAYFTVVPHSWPCYIKKRERAEMD